MREDLLKRVESGIHSPEERQLAIGIFFFQSHSAAAFRLVHRLLAPESGKFRGPLFMTVQNKGGGHSERRDTKQGGLTGRIAP